MSTDLISPEIFSPEHLLFFIKTTGEHIRQLGQMDVHERESIRADNKQNEDGEKIALLKEVCVLYFITTCSSRRPFINDLKILIS